MIRCGLVVDATTAVAARGAGPGGWVLDATGGHQEIRAPVSAYPPTS